MKRTLILFVLILTHGGYSTNEGGTMFEPVALTPEDRQSIERLKREFLKLEDLKVGDGSVAALGRKITADIKVRYASTETLIYDGPAYAYYGMIGGVMIHNSLRERGALSLSQLGVILGLNGMAVGGKRRITVSPGLVCFNGRIEDVPKGANPGVSCLLVTQNRLHGGNVEVRQESLIVEATLTASCIPVFLSSPLIYSGELYCRDAEVPKRDPNAPIWHLYEAPPPISRTLDE